MSPKSIKESDAFPKLNISFLKIYVHNWLSLFLQGISVETITLYRYSGVCSEKKKAYAIVIEVCADLSEDEKKVFEKKQAEFAFYDSDIDDADVSPRVNPVLGIFEEFRDVYRHPIATDYPIAADWTIIPILSGQPRPKDVDTGFNGIELYSKQDPMRDISAEDYSESGIDIKTMQSEVAKSAARTRWDRIDNLMSKATDAALTLWNEGDRKMHNEMADHLLSMKEYSALIPYKKRLMKSLLPEAMKFDLARGVKGSKKHNN